MTWKLHLRHVPKLRTPKGLWFPWFKDRNQLTFSTVYDFNGKSYIVSWVVPLAFLSVIFLFEYFTILYKLAFLSINCVYNFLFLILFILFRWVHWSCLQTHTRIGYQVPLQMVLKHNVVARIELRTSGRAVSALNCWTISPVLYLQIFIFLNSWAFSQVHVLLTYLWGCVFLGLWVPKFILQTENILHHLLNLAEHCLFCSFLHVNK